MKRILITETPNYIGGKVKVSGWVNVVRSHGKILFIDLRDGSGILQVVFLPQEADLYNLVKEVKPEWVVGIVGEVVKRPANMVNPKIPTGQIELVAKELKVLSKAETPPFAIDTDGYEINEEKRMQYRYLDLRRERMQRNLKMRHKVIQFMRDFLTKERFIEIETPILTKSTPEGARDFIVPSRLQPGTFFALPQSPQQYKQLLQVAGFERYFQIARCFRDEDPRADRQAEFTQLDLEMSFVDREDVMEINEKMLIEIVKRLFPTKQIQQIPFPKITHQEAMEKYGTDRPDLRSDLSNNNLLAFCWVTDFPFFEKGEGSGWTFTHNPFSAPKPEYMDDLLKQKNISKILTTQYDIVLNGAEIGGGSIRNHRPEALEAVFEIMGYKKDRIKKNFGHMLQAFKYGAPPHGGIAYGLERFLSVLLQEPNIREVIAFPKTGDSKDLMMDAPAEVDPKQLKELQIQLSAKAPGKFIKKAKIQKKK
ncbi:aspartate--tRNA ligase [Patescibacteria group bacterium]|nr:aspartate--tRNA ligase [Patescibacteria group bacterium]MBU4367822.1 aspartate--tRNA ligase [Patescibacteria group bacterium]MBU4461532.1 aspartate--tRNA ligase [Patescibacteria group bacterium]MCG2700327.1 aspartate--tRNA ligase [Candidatus Parcubacteria bacterium]